MRELLPKTTSRRMRILEYLYIANDWVATNTLALVADCSVKTVIADIDYLSENWTEYFSIENSKQKGVLLYCPPNTTIRSIYSDMLRSSEAFNFMEALFFRPYETADYWKREMFFSESTLYRISKQIAQSLSRRGIYFNYNPHFIYSDDERQTRFFFTSFFLELDGIHHWPFALNRKAIIQLVWDICAKLHITIDDVHVMQLSYLLAVSLIRKSQGFGVDSIAKEKLNPDLQKIFTDQLTQFKEVTKSFQWNLSSDWLEDLSYTTLFYFYSWDNQEEEKRIRAHIGEYIDRICTTLGICASDTDVHKITDMMVYVYTRHKIYPYPNYILYNPDAYPSNVIKYSYIRYSKAAAEALQQLEKDTYFPWFSMYENELLSWTMLRWQGLPLLLDNLRKKVEILVISDLGQDHTKLLKSLIQQNFQDQANVTLNQTSLLRIPSDWTKQITDYDIIISNFPHESFPQNRTIVVDAIPTYRNWSDLQKMIDICRQVHPLKIAYLRL